MVTRRQWLKLSFAAGARVAAGRGLALSGLSAGAAVAATGPTALSGCDDDAPPCDAGDLAATFEVSETGALVSLYSATARRAAIALEDEITGETRAIGEVPLGGDSGGTGAAEIVGLEPARAYRYQVRFNDRGPTPWYRFTTAPEPGAPADLRFVYAADVDVSPAWVSLIFDSMVATTASFFLCLGDWPYADNAPGAQTVDEYRERHRQARGDPRVQRLLRAMPAYAIYDDHEVRNDWDARFRVTERDRIEGALSVWDEWFPLRQQLPRYRSWRWGQHAEFFLLDMRLYRSDNLDPDGPDKTMLGAEQKQWLVDGVRNSDATFKLIATSVPLDFGIGPDHWAAFRTERDEILGAIADAGIRGALFLSADQHWFAAHAHSSGAREFQVGPLARGIPELPPATAAVLARAAVYNFGRVDIASGADGEPRLTFTCLDEIGGEIYRESLSADDLTLG